MPFDLYDYVRPDGTNDFKEWTEGLEKKLQAKLNARLDRLAESGDVLFPQMLAGTDTPGILKLKLNGRVALRPMLCKGPCQIGAEYTLLIGAFEVGGKLKPKSADVIADGRKMEVGKDPKNRRMKHERVS